MTQIILLSSLILTARQNLAAANLPVTHELQVFREFQWAEHVAAPDVLDVKGGHELLAVLGKSLAKEGYPELHVPAQTQIHCCLQKKRNVNSQAETFST